MTGGRVKRGCCAWCDTPVYDVVRSYPADSLHPYAGEAMVCQIPEDSSVRIVTLILTDGSQMSQPICRDCRVTPESLPLIWKKNMAAWAYEIENGPSIGAKPLTDHQKEQQMDHMKAKASTVPLGVLYSEMRARDDRFFQRVRR